MKLLFVISKGLEKAGSAIRAMQFAALAAQQGHPVEVCLIDEAVHWAQGMRAAHGEGLTEYTDLLSTPENPIRVCQPCAEKRLISQDKLIPGTAIAPVPTLVEKMASPDYKVFTF